MVVFSKNKVLTGTMLLGLIVTLAGCGGGGGGGSGVSSSALLVTPTLGEFSSGNVTVTDADGSSVGTGSIQSNGSVSINVPGSAKAPLVVTVSGGTYYDEATGTTLTQQVDLHTVIPAVTNSSMDVAVNPLTNAAATLLGVTGSSLPSGTTGVAVQQANVTVADLVGLQGIDIVDTIPTAIGSSSAQITNAAPADQVGVVLAALSTIAENTNSTADQIEVVTPPSSGPVTGATLGSALKGTAGLSVDEATVDDSSLVLTSDQGALSAVVASSPPESSLTSEQKTAINDATLPSSNTDVVKAKAFFASLRTGVLPYVNPNGNGFLNAQSQEIRADNTIRYSASDRVAWKINQIAFEAQQLAAIIPTLTAWPAPNTALVPGSGCTASSNTDTAICPDYGSWDPATGSFETISITFKNATSATWKTSTNQSGSITIANPTSSTVQLTMNGTFDPMFYPGTETKVGQGNGTGGCLDSAKPLIITIPVDFASSAQRPTIQGDLSNLVPDSSSGLQTCSGFAPDFKISFGTASAPSTDGYMPFQSPYQDTSNTVVTYITKDFTYQGTLALTQITTNNQQQVTGGKASFTGTITGVGLNYVNTNDVQTPLETDPSHIHNFTILSGTLSGNASGTPSYKAYQPASASNYMNGSLTFTGQAYDSSLDKGLKLVLSVNQNWTGSAYQDGLTISYYDQNNNLKVTGTSSFVPGQPVDAMTISSGNGVNATWDSKAASNPVTIGSTTVANISQGKVTYMDGTFESLL